MTTSFIVSHCRVKLLIDIRRMPLKAHTKNKNFNSLLRENLQYFILQDANVLCTIYTKWPLWIIQRKLLHWIRKVFSYHKCFMISVWVWHWQFISSIMCIMTVARYIFASLQSIHYPDWRCNQHSNRIYILDSLKIVLDIHIITNGKVMTHYDIFGFRWITQLQYSKSYYRYWAIWIWMQL